MTDRGVAIVTGGASGIGFAIAEALLADSWKPILADLAHGPFDTACARLDAPRANATKCILMDVANEASMITGLGRCGGRFERRFRPRCRAGKCAAGPRSCMIMRTADIGWIGGKRSDYIELQHQDLSLSVWNICI